MGCKAEDYIELMYGRTSYSYENINMSSKNDGISLFGNKDNMGLNGFGLEQVVGLPLSVSLPMYIETGLKFQAGWGKIKEENLGYGEKCSVNLFRLNIPLRYIYHIRLAENFKLAPYLGVDFRFNLASRGRYNFYQGDNVIASERINYFSKDDMGDDRFNRFQFGWHVGLRFEMSFFDIFAMYCTDFTKLYNDKVSNEKISTGNLAVGFGLTF